MNDHTTLGQITTGAHPAVAQIGHGLPQALVPQTFDEVYRFAQIIAKSDLVPYNMRTPEKIAVALLQGLELGLKPMQAMNSIAVINGRPSLYGDGAMGLVLASGLLEDHEEWFEGVPGSDDWTAHCRMKRRGRERPIHRFFSIGQAKVAGLWGKLTNKGEPTPWITHPDRMLMMRARGFAQRDGFADVLRGMPLFEELQDVPEAEFTEVGEIPAGPAHTVSVSLDPAEPAFTEPGKGGSAASEPASPERSDADWEVWLGDLNDALAQIPNEEAVRRTLADILSSIDGVPREVVARAEFHAGQRINEINRARNEAEAKAASDASAERYREQLRERERAKLDAAKEGAIETGTYQGEKLSEADYDKLIDELVAGLRKASSVALLDAFWDSDVVPSNEKYEIKLDDQTGLKDVYTRRKRLLEKKVG